MKLKLFNVRIDALGASSDQEALNAFLSAGIKVEKTSTQFVPGNPDFWSILVFYTGEAVQQPKRTPVITEEDLNDTQKGLFAALRLWRKDRAAEINLPEFMVFHNATLMMIAAEQPTRLEHLYAIKGIGDQKIRMYGDDIIAISCAF